MKTCLFVFSHPAPYKVHLFNGLSQKLDLTVIFERHLGKYNRQQYLEKDQYRFKTIFLKGLAFGKDNHLSFELVHHLKKHHYDIIIMNGYSSLTEILAIRYLQKHHLPYYLYVNGGVIRKDPFWRFRLKKSLISHAAGYFSPTPIADDYLRYYGAKGKPIYHYPYSTIFKDEILTQPLSNEAKQTLRKELNLPLNKKICISVGQFIDRKNFSTLIRLWRLIPTHTELLIIGDGEQKQRLTQLVKSLKLDHVRILPFQPKKTLLKFFQACDGLILLSKEDIYGHVINEALSQGLPVLSSDRVISAKVLIQPGKNGLILSLNHLDDFSTMLNRLITDMNTQACIDAAKPYHIEAMVQVHQQTIAQLTV